MTYAAPAWLRRMMVSDLARSMPVGTPDETLANAERTIDAAYRARGIDPIWLLDGESGQVYGPQGDGDLQGWKATAVQYLYPDGSWLFLDGGALDLGLVRDSALNATNDFQAFAETFEEVHFHGVFSYRVAQEVCANGVRGALDDLDVCTTHS